MISQSQTIDIRIGLNILRKVEAYTVNTEREPITEVGSRAPAELRGLMGQETNSLTPFKLKALSFGSANGA